MPVSHRRRAAWSVLRRRWVSFDTDPGQEDVCCTPILAPASGIVLDIDVISARPVTAGTRLLTVGDPTWIEIVAGLLSSDAVRLPHGAKARVERWGGDPLDARLLYIEPRRAHQGLGAWNRGTARRCGIRTDLAPNARTALGHGFAVFLRIVEYREADAMLVPLQFNLPGRRRLGGVPRHRRPGRAGACGARPPQWPLRHRALRHLRRRPGRRTPRDRSF